MLLEPGSLLNNRYRIVEVLGQGGMGSVYCAIDENLEIHVAVKDNLFTTEEFARQFHREASILARLRHPNLPRVTDYFEIGGQGQYLVMDYIEGEDLRERMDRVGRIPEQEVVLIGAAICDALAYMCSRTPPVIHRDIKPGNVKITPEGEIFLVDFGLAKTMQGSQVTTTGARAMTPGYSPPEQYGTARTDMRTDIFSLGATLYAALTNVIPEESLSRGLGQVELTPIRSHNKTISRKIAAVVEKALEIHPGDRYQTPEEFKQALLESLPASRKLTGYHISPPPPDQEEADEEGSSIERAKPVPSKSPAQPLEGDPASILEQPLFREYDSRPNRKRRNTSCVLVLAALLTLASLYALVIIQYPSLYSRIYSTVQSILRVPSKEPLAANLSAVPGTATKTALSTQPPETPVSIIAPLASITPFLESTQTVSIVNPTSTATMLPTPVGGGAGQIAFASDLSGVPQIYLIGSDSANRQQITEIPEGACQPDFSPDGSQIVFVSPCESNNDYYPGASLYIINLDGSGLLPLPTMRGGDFDPAWSPDGNQIAFTSLRGNNRTQIFSIDMKSKEVILLSEKYMLDTQPTWTPDGEHILFVSERNGKKDIWQMDVDGANRILFSHTPNFLDVHPSVSPDGKAVLITQYLTLGGVPRVVAAPFGSESYVEYEIGKEKRPMRHAVMSPDGFWIAFEGWEAGGKHNIYLITTTGISIQQVTNDQHFAFDPTWRPVPPQ